MTIRPLTPDEWPLLAPIFAAEGGSLPSPDMARVIGAFDDAGALAGFWTVQVAYHAGPLWIRPDQRGTGLWRRLHGHLCHSFRQMGGRAFYSFSGEARVEAMFAKLGYEPLGYKVWSKEV